MNGGKKMEIGQAILSAAYIALGIVLIVHPGIAGIIICRAIGLFFLLFGGFREFVALRARGANWGYQLHLAINVIAIAFGIFSLARPQEVLSVLPVVLGVYLLMECVGKIQRALLLKSFGYVRWWTALLTGLLAAALGVLLLVNPFAAMESMLRFLGVSLVVDGVSDLWILWCLAAHGGK